MRTTPPSPRVSRVSALWTSLVSLNVMSWKYERSRGAAGAGGPNMPRPGGMAGGMSPAGATPHILNSEAA